MKGFIITFNKKASLFERGNKYCVSPDFLLLFLINVAFKL